MHKIQPRKVAFDLSATPLHWLPNQPFASQLINSAHLFLPAGEFAFCRIFNQALPLIRDPKLREDVQAFIRQEAMHARAHGSAVADYLTAHGVETESFSRRIEWLFAEGPLGDKPFGHALPKRLNHQWMLFRLGAIAALEHSTCVFGNYLLENSIWAENGGDPELIDLLRWHGAEEVEHRCVAFDLYQHLGGIYPTRYYLKVVAIPVMTGLLFSGAVHLMRQDPAFAGKKPSIWRPWIWREWSRVAKAGYLPSPAWMLGKELRYLNPWYDPETEGSTEQALAYLASSPGVARLAASRCD